MLSPSIFIMMPFISGFILQQWLGMQIQMCRDGTFGSPGKETRWKLGPLPYALRGVSDSSLKSWEEDWVKVNQLHQADSKRCENRTSKVTNPLMITNHQSSYVGNGFPFGKWSTHSHMVSDLRIYEYSILKIGWIVWRGASNGSSGAQFRTF